MPTVLATCELQNNSTNLGNGLNWRAGCFGGSPGRSQDTILSIPIIINGNPHLCKHLNSDLSTSQIPEGTYQWNLDNVKINSAQNFELPIENEGSYQVEIAVRNCTGISDPLQVTEAPRSLAPRTHDVVRCGSGPVLLQAASDESIFWFDKLSGNILETGNVFLTPSINENTIFYVVSGQHCPSIPLPVMVRIDESCKNNLVILPNPSNTQNISVVLDNTFHSGDLLLSVFDSFGKLISERHVHLLEFQTTFEMNVSGLSAGIYMLTAKQDDVSSTAKLVRQK